MQDYITDNYRKLLCLRLIIVHKDRYDLCHIITLFTYEEFIYFIFLIIREEGNLLQCGTYKQPVTAAKRGHVSGTTGIHRRTRSKCMDE